jgi:hypothetical protein
MTTSFMVTLLSEKAGVMEYWTDGVLVSPLICTRLRGIPMDALACNQDEFNTANVEYRTKNFE